MEVTILLLMHMGIAVTSVSRLTSTCVRRHELCDDTSCVYADHIAADVVAPCFLERPTAAVRILFPTEPPAHLVFSRADIQSV